MKKTIIKIDRELCVGCGACVSRCHQDALQLVDGKAVLVNDNYCDGLGNCIGECPLGAITFEEREPDFEPARKAFIMAPAPEPATPMACGCPGSVVRKIEHTPASELRHFPVQLHLVNPQAEFFRGADLLLAADCTAYSCGDFHSRFLNGKALAIACPKLDNNTDSYVEKLTAMIDSARIERLTVLVMEVPCCAGLVRIAKAARERAQRNIHIKVIVLSVSGEIVSEE